MCFCVFTRVGLRWAVGFPIKAPSLSASRGRTTWDNGYFLFEVRVKACVHSSVSCVCTFVSFPFVFFFSLPVCVLRCLLRYINKYPQTLKKKKKRPLLRRIIFIVSIVSPVFLRTSPARWLVNSIYGAGCMLLFSLASLFPVAAAVGSRTTSRWTAREFNASTAGTRDWGEMPRTGCRTTPSTEGVAATTRTGSAWW